jgi:hypothetical protein
MILKSQLQMKIKRINQTSLTYCFFLRNSNHIIFNSMYVCVLLRSILNTSQIKKGTI